MFWSFYGTLHLIFDSMTIILAHMNSFSPLNAMVFGDKELVKNTPKIVPFANWNNKISLKNECFLYSYPI